MHLGHLQWVSDAVLIVVCTIDLSVEIHFWVILHLEVILKYSPSARLYSSHVSSISTESGKIKCAMILSDIIVFSFFTMKTSIYVAHSSIKLETPDIRTPGREFIRKLNLYVRFLSNFRPPKLFRVYFES